MALFGAIIVLFGLFLTDIGLAFDKNGIFDIGAEKLIYFYFEPLIGYVGCRIVGYLINFSSLW